MSRAIDSEFRRLRFLIGHVLRAVQIELKRYIIFLL